MVKRLTYAMMGGGPDGSIGDAHCRAIGPDGAAVIAVGVLSRNCEKSLQMAESLGIFPDRCHEDYQTMARAEGEREDGIDFATVVAPNQPHYEICRTFLEAGIHVVRDKPMTTMYRQAKELEALTEDKEPPFMVTYTYMGYMTAEYARESVVSGAIGGVRTITAEYPQGWPAPEDDFGGKQGEWHCDPGQSGGVNCLGDLGTHMENAVATMTGFKTKRLLVKMDVTVSRRVLDDNDSILVEYDNDATEIYRTSQVVVGHDNSLRIRIYGSKGAIQWSRETSDKIMAIDADNTIQEMHRGYGAIGGRAGKYAGVLAGHPKDRFEVMGNFYHSFVQCASVKRDGTFTVEMVDCPAVSQGAERLAFVKACLESNQSGNTWVEFRRK